jgi:hypothetical protein
MAIKDKKKGGMMITFEFVVNKDQILEERQYDLPLDGIAIEVISEINGRKGKVECSELLKAFEDFSSKTRAVLEELVPELKQNPEIAYWFVKSG